MLNFSNTNVLLGVTGGIAAYKSAEIIRAFASKSNYSKLQEAMLGGDLETEIRNAVKSIYPCRNVVIRKSQLLQTGVVSEKGPTLDEIHAEESRQEAELKAKKAAALEAAEDEENSGDGDLLAAAEAMESISEKEEVTETPSEEEDVETAEEETTQTETDKSSGKQKLKDLGLTDAEIKALTGA